MKKFIFGGLLALLASCGGTDPAASERAEAAPTNSNAHGLIMVEREVDSSIGRELFVEKGCVICHAVNGVGGKAAPALDAPIGSEGIDALDFAARMWRGAPAMIELQAVELGYSIFLTADEIANIAAFAADRIEQEELTPDQLPDNIRDGLLDEQFWEMEDWDDFLRTGREGNSEETAE